MDRTTEIFTSILDIELLTARVKLERGARE
jgi:hypothetical protein